MICWWFISSTLYHNWDTSTAGICWIESTELRLAINRVVAASDPRDVVIVVIRNVPHPTLPDGPAGGRRHAEADHQGEGDELKEIYFIPDMTWFCCVTTMKIFISPIFFKLIQSQEKIKYLYYLGLAYYHIPTLTDWHIFLVRSK